MKNIRYYNPSKYSSSEYNRVQDNIYKTLYYSNDSLILIKENEIGNVLSKMNGWKKSNFSGMYSILYNNKEYYIDERNYNNGVFNQLFINKEPEEIYVVSLVFEQEPEYGENNPDSWIISQYPLEDILDKYRCWCTDFYKEENNNDKVNSYQEFASNDLDDIIKLTEIVGKHVYNKEENGYVKLIVE